MKIAMILAAGRGERLRPLTDEIPKALCKVHDKPLIEYHIAKLAQCGFERIVINHAHLGGQIRRYLGDGSQWDIEICYAPEPPGGLETGGGIYNALPLLGSEPFLTVNADILTGYDFNALHLPAKTLVKLVLVPNPSHNQQGDFGLNQQRLTNEKTYTFPGIACYHPDAFRHCQPGRYSVVPLIRSLAEQNLAAGEIYEGLWMDIGSPERLKLASTMSI
ncbi:N-acetylmuramate alpha-1-phosphate uridylyltransferase MurU [Legionella hackeliae]|uniref:Glucose-1-phosphate thymidylyltransferase n=1 Tax=Legionella hackeliae TaxID=449 RepID=A0A0A8UPF5_LEGHA|nr:nucleotidyltransferase family protein [Legionella hackeliae]KTD13573.1 nucleotidyltransferase [Legionella hackeliae]CEK09421.1 Glucose-1-phosphate thymidylyltransferase [Legionella hackeliae]STX49329.1 nucleotidyltransferase [Legionella hackeliae]